MEFINLALILIGFVGLAIYLKKPKANSEDQFAEKDSRILLLEKEITEKNTTISNLQKELQIAAAKTQNFEQSAPRTINQIIWSIKSRLHRVLFNSSDSYLCGAQARSMIMRLVFQVSTWETRSINMQCFTEREHIDILKGDSRTGLEYMQVRQLNRSINQLITKSCT